MPDGHNNRSPNPFNWDPILFFTVWAIVVIALLAWELGMGS